MNPIDHHEGIMLRRYPTIRHDIDIIRKNFHRALREESMAGGRDGDEIQDKEMFAIAGMVATELAPLFVEVLSAVAVAEAHQPGIRFKDEVFRSIQRNIERNTSRYQCADSNCPIHNPAKV